MEGVKAKSNIIYSKVTNAGKDKYVGLKIINIDDLKNATPHVKLPSILSAKTHKKSEVVSEEIKQKLHKYCRTCAGLKFPLIDIFSEKGNQMRLLQQIQHLEDINKDDSLSTQMCMDCIYDMKISYKFFMQIKKAEMKLRSIYNSFNNTSKLSQLKVENEIDSLSEEKEKEIVLVPGLSVTTNNDSWFENEKLKNIADDSYEILSDDTDELFEEFDPNNLVNKVDESVNNGTKYRKILPKIDNPNKIAYKFDEKLNAYVKVESNQEETTMDLKTNNTSITIKKETISTAPINQSPKLPNILKRKSTTENKSESFAEKISKMNLKQLSVKIPRLDLEDPVNVTTGENGVMYVTTKGTNPNEMLLIKVKKMDKDKKTDKEPVKKKVDSNIILKTQRNTQNSHEKDIEKQIEQYKKKRVEVLGDIANISQTSIEETPEIPEIRSVEKDISDTGTDIKIEIKEEIEASNESMVENFDDNSMQSFHDMASSIDSDIETDNSQEQSKTIKITDDVTNENQSEDITKRLKNVLKQKDEFILEFFNFLKQRKIIVSHLNDDDIVALYEAKNNVVLEKLPLNEDPSENEDPFEYKQVYDCDFCFRFFLSREMEREHAKIHDIKLMHYCEDCEQEFQTNKAKRAHNVTCVQKWMCKYCDMILDSKGKKRQHEQKHCDEQFGQLCDMCGEKFKHLGTLDQHIKSRHMELEKIFKCPQCPKRFAFRTKLTFHLKTVHTNTRDHLCEDCGHDFKNPASLRHHRMRKHLTSDNMKECKECKKMVPIYSMSKHMHTHKAYSIECPQCDKRFKNTSTLKQHLRIHEDQRQYKCDHCGVGFNRRDGLRLHLRVHEKSDSKGLKECSCQLCGEKFPSHSMLVIHRNRTHKDGRNYTCHICNRSMISSRSLDWHLSHIHNESMPSLLKGDIDEKTKRVSCRHCTKTFKTEMILRSHVRNTHAQKERMNCPDCGEEFTSEVRMKHHMMIAHDHLEDTIPCPHCPKRFVNQLRLKTHMVAHSEVRPFKCDLCDFRLKTRIQLVKHKQNKHSNERPLQCKYCPWRCKQVSALVCHERTHTNERPYSCSECGQAFKYLGDRNKHERRHESLGGSGFKRKVVSRDTSKRSKRYNQTLEQSSEQDQETTEGNADESNEQPVQELGQYQDMEVVKLEGGEDAVEGSEASFNQVYSEETSQDISENNVVMNMEEVYTEEVTADDLETGIVTHEIINDSVLQPGTVVHLQQRDETGKIQVIPVMLSLPDLSDANNEVNLENASIMYTN